VFVQPDYMADNADDHTADKFLEFYLLWLFGRVLFCESMGDSVSRCMIPWAQRIAAHPSSRCPKSAGAALFRQLLTGGCVQQ
jgi:hypothetical protein